MRTRSSLWRLLLPIEDGSLVETLARIGDMDNLTHEALEAFCDAIARFFVEEGLLEEFEEERRDEEKEKDTPCSESIDLR